MTQTAFALTNAIALLGWLALIVGPRRPAVLSAVMYLGVALLCLAYVAIAAWLVTHPGGGGGLPEYSPAGLSQAFADPRIVVLGWTHYLALDLFTGLWIARDGDHKGFSRLVQAPVLILTILAGPIGLLVWLGLRERRAREKAPRSGKRGALKL
jgi:hypothetical protein